MFYFIIAQTLPSGNFPADYSHFPSALSPERKELLTLDNSPASSVMMKIRVAFQLPIP